jgi:transcriptional regulator GlxA family with amidase domain
MRVVFLVFPGFQSLDLTGPLEVFSLAGGYEVETVGMGGGVVRAHSGIAVVPDRAAEECAGPIDTLVVVGGEGVVGAVEDAALLDWVLAVAGLLEGRDATTHWRVCGMLGDLFPEVDVQEDRIFVVDGEVWTSAGVTSGIDMALAMVERDLGPDTALRVARELVVFVQRPGGQAQFSTQLSASRPEHPALAELQSWIPEHLDTDLSVSALAERAAMSPRHFARLFARETGLTPGAYVESVRVETARRLLESTALPVDVIARTCGFGTPETMHRSFRRRISVTPGAYRRRFSAR